jgi:P27 family predicted phage terminase small subunit
MGLRGPAPKPTALRIVEGNLSHRPLPEGEPKPRELAPIAPEHLDEVGTQFHSRLIEVMGSVRGWLTEADFATLGEAAYWYAEYRRYAEFIRVNGDIYVAAFTDSAGQEHKQFKPMPQVKMRKDAWVECMKLLDRLGLSPAARARMVISKRADEDDDLDAH